MNSKRWILALLTAGGLLCGQAPVIAQDGAIVTRPPGPSGGGGSPATWDGGAFSASATGPTGCVTPAYSFTADAASGLCLAAAGNPFLSSGVPAGGGEHGRIELKGLTGGAGYAYFDFYDDGALDSGVRAFDNTLQLWSAGVTVGVFGGTTFTSVPITIQGSTSPLTLTGTSIGNGFDTTIDVVEPTADHIITFPDATGDVAVIAADGFAVRAGAQTWVAREFTSGDGSVVIANPAGTAGNVDLTVDSSVFSRFQTATANASGNCSPGIYWLRTDTNELWHCTATNTWTKYVKSAVTLTADLPVIGGGTSAVAVGTRSGNTTAYVTTTGAQTSGDCVEIDASGNHIASGAACGGSAEPDPSTLVVAECEMLGPTQSGATTSSSLGGDCTGFSSVATGGINSVDSAADATTVNHPGVRAIDLGTVTNAESYAYTNYWNIGGGGETVFDAWVKTRASLSDGTDTYTLTVGFVDSFTFASIANGCYVQYSHGINSGKWQYTCEAANSPTNADSGVTVVVNTWYHFKITVNAAGTSVNFLINGANSADIVATIPASTVEVFGIVHGDRDAGTAEIAGGYIDYIRVRQVISR